MNLLKVTVQCARQRTQRKSKRRIWLITVDLVLLALTSCELSVTTSAPSGAESALSPTASSAPLKTDTSPPLATAITSVTDPPQLAIATTKAGPLAITAVNADVVGRYELLELEVHSDIIPANPFDPQELDIRVEFTAPSGKTIEIGAFWYQDFDLNTRIQVGDPGWKARFTPTESGAWTAVARVPERGLESAAVSFDVVESDRPGFVGVHPNNPRYFAFDDGSFFFPIGMNIAWWSGSGNAITDYKKWMDPFAANGGNAMRVWMAEWSFGIEWNDTPLGDYTNRLKRAWYLDQIFNMADERDVYILLVLLNCADFNNWQTKGWDGNPYNAEHGGPLENPEQYVTDPSARDLLKRRLNYVVNRWGYSPRLLAWEWWNEVNLAPFTDETLIPWLQEMTAYLLEQDVNQHLVTNSYAIRDLSPIWDLPEMDIIQKHEYALQVDSPVKDLAERAAVDISRLANSAPGKPILLGEFGYGNEGLGQDVDRTGIHLHNGIWATTFVGYAGSGMYWYWDVYVEAYSVWHHFRGLSRFLEDVDLSRYEPFSPLEISGPGGVKGQAVGLGLRGDDVLIWLRSEAYTVQASEVALQELGSSGFYLYRQPLVEGQVLTLRDMDDGEYTVHWFDPQAVRWLNPVEATAQGDQLSIPIPDFNRDLAARIVPDR